MFYSVPTQQFTYGGTYEWTYYDTPWHEEKSCDCTNYATSFSGLTASAKFTAQYGGNIIDEL